MASRILPLSYSLFLYHKNTMGFIYGSGEERKQTKRIQEKKRYVEVYRKRRIIYDQGKSTS